MSRMFRLTVGAALVAAAAAGMVAFADPAQAQPPGFGKDGDRGFEKGKGKGFDKKGDARPKAEPTPSDSVRSLEAELAKVKEQEAALEAKLKRAKEEAARAARQPLEPPFRGGSGGLLGGGGSGFGGLGGGLGGLPIERMSAEQIKEMIAQLQKVLEEKTKAAAPPPRPSGDRGSGGGRAVVPQGEILKRLDKLTQEVEELRRSIRR